MRTPNKYGRNNTVRLEHNEVKPRESVFNLLTREEVTFKLDL